MLRETDRSGTTRRRLRRLVRALRRQDGLSLVEVMIAAAVLLVIALAVLPMFTHAMVANTRGSDSSKLVSHTRAELERFMQVPYDHPDLDLEVAQTACPACLRATTNGPGAPAGQELVVSEQQWDDRARAASPADPRELDDGAWIALADAPAGDVYWQRTTLIRQFSIADISEGVIDPDGNDLLVEGDPFLFDSPKAAGTPEAFRHAKEVEIVVDSQKAAGAPTSRVSVLRVN